MINSNITNTNTGEIINPFISDSTYNLYFFSPGTNINISFNTNVIGNILLSGPGGNGYNSNRGGTGGIGSAYIYEKNILFLGKNYSYNISVPNGVLPSEGETVNLNTILSGYNFTYSIESNYESSNNSQSSYGYKQISNNKNLVSTFTKGGVGRGDNTCNLGEPSSYTNPDLISNATIWVGGAGSGGNSAKSGSMDGHGGRPGMGLGGGVGESSSLRGCGGCCNPSPGDNALNNSGSTFYFGNGGGGGGRGQNGGMGSFGGILISIPIQTEQILTYSEMGYSNFTYDNTNIMGKIKIIKNEPNLRELNFYCPSLDGINCYNDLSKLNYPPDVNQSEIGCNITYDDTNIPKTFQFNSGDNIINSDICNKIFTNYNLYPTNNPLTVVGPDVNAPIYNTITNHNELITLASQYQNDFENTNTDSAINNSMNNILQQTPLKLGCCRRLQTDNSKKNVGVKVSISPNTANLNDVLYNLNYENKIFTIPDNSCPVNLYKGSNDCNVYFASYCQNYYDYLQSKGLSNSDKLLQIPECACYFPKTEDQNYYPAGTPSICYKDGCSASAAYLDPTSIKPDGSQVQCDLTVCQNIVNTAGLSAGGDATITPTLQNNCGQYIPPDNSNISNTNTSNTNSTNISNNNSTNNNSTNSNASNTNSYLSLTYIIVIIVIILIIIFIVYYFFSKKNITKRY